MSRVFRLRIFDGAGGWRIGNYFITLNIKEEFVKATAFCIITVLMVMVFFEK